MKTIKQTITKEIPQLEISYDTAAENPREYGDNLGYFISIDRDYNSPDKHAELEAIVKNTGQEAESQAQHMKLITDLIATDLQEKVIYITPIVKYEHGNVSYSRGARHGFDFSNNGFYIVTDKTFKNSYSKKNEIEKNIDAELKIYNQYVNGEVYCFTLYDTSGDIEDSRGGYYSIEDIRGDLPDEWKDEDMNEYFNPNLN